jgi:hypothetical protein
VDSTVNHVEVFALAVMGVSMTAREQATDHAVMRRFIGHDAGFPCNVGFQNWDDGGALHVVNHDRAGLSGGAVD